jgi:hypothetical protein
MTLKGTASWASKAVFPFPESEQVRQAAVPSPDGFPAAPSRLSGQVSKVGMKPVRWG